MERKDVLRYYIQTEELTRSLSFARGTNQHLPDRLTNAII
jgi:hypothetical protein